jgi:translocation and assembly module TamA
MIHFRAKRKSAVNVKFLSLIFTVLFYVGATPLPSYELQYTGIPNAKIKDVIQSVSSLEKLKANPPATILGLKRRAEADASNILEGLHSLAYYDAKVDCPLNEDGTKVFINIEAGIIYPFGDFEVRYTDNPTEVIIPLEELKIKIGAPALPETILAAEELLLERLNLRGYPFASIKKRDVFADQRKKNVIVIIDVETGPLSYFGPLTISGEERTLKRFFYKKLKWVEGDLYDPRRIEKTREALELSGLFRSVNVTHPDEPVEGNLIPLKISVVEGKQRSVGFGLSYNTELGPGVTGEWEDRNFTGEGDKLSFRADIWQILQEGRLAYLIPAFKRPDQNLLWILDYRQDQTKGFTDSTFSLSAILERKLSERLRLSSGVIYKLINTRHSELNGIFNLIQIPLQLRWSNVDNLLDPSEGLTVNLKSVPSVQFLGNPFFYCSNTFTGSFYRPLTQDKRHIIAFKLMLGSIVGAGKNEIPPPERFYAGSENALRGYNYLTVSPLDRHHKPIGGRSLFIYSLELRNKIGKNFGWVAFYEIGNVYFDFYPDLNKPMLQSVGLGLRYYTPVGPLRVDAAVPLNRRPHVDAPLQVYFSIGQSF